MYGRRFVVPMELIITPCSAWIEEVEACELNSCIVGFAVGPVFRRLRQERVMRTR